MSKPGVCVPEQHYVPWPVGLASVDHLVYHWLSAGCSPGDQKQAKLQLASCIVPETLVNAPTFHLQLMLHLPEAVIKSLWSKTGISCSPSPSPASVEVCECCQQNGLMVLLSVQMDDQGKEKTLHPRELK